MTKKLFGDWDELIGECLDKNLMDRVKAEYKNNSVLPPSNQLFESFMATSLSEVKVVILGTQPSISRLNSRGIAFGCNRSMDLTLHKIFEAFDREVEFGRYLNLCTLFDFKYLTEQGVLMINCKMTVIEGKISSHSDIGWDEFISKLLILLSSRRNGIVFSAWGREPTSIIKRIHNKYPNKHYYHSCEAPELAVIQGRDWNNNNCFSRINEFLDKKDEIIW